VILKHEIKSFFIRNKGIDFVRNWNQKVWQEIGCHCNLLGKGMKNRCSDGPVANWSREEGPAESRFVNKQIIIKATSRNSETVHSILLRVTDRTGTLLSLAKRDIYRT
jgi:hypothetical protein